MLRWLTGKPEKDGPMWLIVGLGNPGEQYDKTRHNIGFHCIKHLAERHHLAFDRKRSQARLAEGNIAGQRVALAKPYTFMNLSGRAVVGLCNWYKLDPAQELLVIYDDLDLPFGKLRIRQRGSAGTHNGMKSIINLTGRQDFPRLRVGIGSPPPRWDTSSYVLGNFTAEERKQLPDIYDRAADALELVLREGLVAAMNQFNA
jgi:PTH1 family peptidyl-tRNA hydrolase